MIREAEDPLTALASKWQAILKLRDWDVRIVWAKASELVGCTARVTPCYDRKEALIQILEPQEFVSISRVAHWLGFWPQDVERSIVHELLHLHFHGHDTFLEQGIVALADTLVTLDRKS